MLHSGGLDTSPSTMTDAQKQRTGFWLLPMWAGKDRDRFAEAMKRVAGEITTTFATSYSKRGGCPGFSAAALGCLKRCCAQRRRWGWSRR